MPEEEWGAAVVDSLTDSEAVAQSDKGLSQDQLVARIRHPK